MTTYSLRRTSAGGVVTDYQVTGTRYEDRAIVAGAAYAYAIVRGSSGTSSLDVLSNVDVGSTLPFTSIVPGTLVDDSYFNELLDAVNALRAIKGWPKLTWASIMPSSVPVPATGGLIQASYLALLRPRMNDALQALGVPVAGYSDPDPKSVRITAQHVTEIQRRAQ